MTLPDILAVHSEVLKFGPGREGIVSLPSIESAIGRPYTGYYRSIHKKAAALAESLARNHGFVDGNKRTTLLTLALFLSRSGYGLGDAGEELNEDLETLVVELASGKLSFDDCVNWFKRKLVKV